MVVLRKSCLFLFMFLCSCARASHFALFGGCFAHFYVIHGLTGYLFLCLRWLGWYLRNAIVVGTFGGDIERRLCFFRLSVNVSDARALHFA